MKKQLLLPIIFFLTTGTVFTQNIKGFYVDGFNTILGNTLREDSLLLFAKNNGFNYLTLYNIYQVNTATPLTNTSTAQSFASFVQKAKTQYSIAEIGVAGENYAFFSNIINVYNQQHPIITQKVDVYNLEFEFWIPSSVAVGSYYCNTYLQPAGYSCDTAGAFAFYKKTLKRIDSLANANGRKSEAYFGFFNSGQGKQIVQTGVDRVLLSVYIPSGNYSSTYQYNYASPRLINLAGANTNIKIMTLYSAEPTFMQSWATINPYFKPYNDFANSLALETGIWKNYIQDEGIQWFAYSYLPKKNMVTDIRLRESEIQKVNVFPNPANGIIHIRCESCLEGGWVDIVDFTGKTLLSSKITSIDTNLYPDLENGVYFVKVKLNNQQIYTQKLIIK